MADNPLTLEKMLRGSQNLDVWETATSGDENTDWTNLVGDKGPSLKKAIKLIMSKAPINSTPFATKAALLADTTLTDNALAFVYNDTDDSNGLYQKVSGAWVYQTWNPTNATKQYVKDNVKSFVGLRSGINIIDPSKRVDGYYVNYAGGTLNAAPWMSTLGAYEIKPSTEYQTNVEYYQQFAFYDAGMNYISGQANPGDSRKFTTPANAKYVKFSVLTDDIPKFMVTESSVFPSAYTPYVEYKDDLRVKGNQLEDVIVDASNVTNLASTVQNSVGIYQLNIIDKSKRIDGYYVNFSAGNLNQAAWMSTLGEYPIKPNTEYQVTSTYIQQFAFYDANMKYVSGLPNPAANHKFVTPANARFVKFAILPSDIDTFVVAESSVFPTEYKPHTAKILKGIELPNSNNVTTITVSADITDTEAQFTGKNAIQEAIDSITDASATNRYKILVKAGLYKITKANEYIGNRGYPAMICPKDYVDIVGQGNDKTIVWAELPYDDSQIGASIDGNTYDRYKYQTIYNFANNVTIEDITFVAVNLRYTLHQDSPIGANKSRHYKNVNLLFKGNKGALKPFGLGTYEGEQTYVSGGYSESDTSMAFSCHNNSKFNTPSLWHFEGHNFTSLGSNIVIQPQNLGSLVNDKIELIGCSFGGQGYVINYFDQWGTAQDVGDHFNHAEWQITGYGNDPFLFTNNSDGYSLRIKSNAAVGVGNKVRFDVNSTAYPLLVKDKHRNTDVNLYVDSLELVDGYIAKDGSVGLPAQAIGAIDISAKSYENDAGVNYTSLAKRLGDLSSNSKTLTVLVNGVANNIVFNKNYSNMTNAQIIAEINAQLTNATADVYSYGRDYYPMMSDVSEYVYNTTNNFIPKGSLITKQGGAIKLANGNDKVFGVALDDIPVVTTDSQGIKRGQGRVLKRGYISADRSKAHFVLADNQNPSIGTRFAVSNGQLVTDNNGKISVDIDNSIVSINC